MSISRDGICREYKNTNPRPTIMTRCMNAAKDSIPELCEKSRAVYDSDLKGVLKEYGYDV